MAMMTTKMNAKNNGKRPARLRRLGALPRRKMRRLTGAARTRRVGEWQEASPDVRGARIAVLLNGVPEELVEEAELHGTVDWRPLAGALDGLFMAAGGDRGVRAFWSTPYEELHGKTPLDVFPLEQAPDALEKLVRKETKRTQLAKLR